METVDGFRSPPGVTFTATSGSRPLTQAGGDLSFSKQCIKCGELKALGEFSKSSCTKSGLQNLCRGCIRKRDAKWRENNRGKLLVYNRKWRQNNPEKCRATMRKWVEANLEKKRATCRKYQRLNPEKQRARQRKWAAAHPEKCRAMSRRWTAANSEKVQARNRAWALANPEKYSEVHRVACRAWTKANPKKVLAYAARHRARKFSAPGAGYTTVQHVQWRWEMWGNRCWVCGDKATATDHVIALSKGGSHWPANLRPICKPCNSRKGAKKLAEFLELDKHAGPVVPCARIGRLSGAEKNSKHQALVQIGNLR